MNRRTLQGLRNATLRILVLTAWLCASPPAGAGLIDLGDLSTADGFRFRALGAGGSVAHAIATGDVNGDGFDDLVVGSGSAGPDQEGEVSVVYGGPSMPPETLPSELDGSTGFRIRPDRMQRDGWFGYRVTTGDLNGDGFADVVVGAPYLEVDGATESGQVYVLFGRDRFPAVVDFADGIADGERGFVIEGVEREDFVGWAVSALDLNGDGLDELAVNKATEPFSSDDFFVLYGRPDYPPRMAVTAIEGDRGFRIAGIADPLRNETLFLDPAGGDFNGDGLDDLLLASNTDPYNPRPREGYIVYGAERYPALLGLDHLDGSDGVLLSGSDNTSTASVRAAGDVDGDGFDDILFRDDSSAHGLAGSVFLVYGAASLPPHVDLTAPPADGYSLIVGESYERKLRGGVSGVGDLDGDGFDDFMLGAEWVERRGELVGAAYTVFGTADRPETIELGDPLRQLAILGGETDRYIGHELAGGDVNGDGLADMVVDGSRRLAGPGRTYVLYGAPSALP